MKNVVVVESPAKAKTINKYLGPDYTVLASYGHVRDLPSRDGSVIPDEDFKMSWEVDTRAKKNIDDIIKALKGADHLYLATDPDREGEAISWHILEVLEKRKVLKDVEVSRVAFHEITRNAIIEAIKSPRELDQALIEAYLARRALDYLVGFTLSPILWRKLPGSRSAGRVQSVALRLICERESQIEVFKPEEHWSVEGHFSAPCGTNFTSRLSHLDGKKLEKFSLTNQAAAAQAVATAQNATYKVDKVERKTVRRNPQPPFTTSTLQQEASRKLGFGTSRTMRTAQRLYEGINLGGETVGLITYMRTDSVVLSGEAMNGCRSAISNIFGASYLPASPRFFKTKAKNAQEAHEAIRPTSLNRQPKDVGASLDDDQRRLYELIWKRTMASQMENARLEQVAVDLNADNGKAVFRANGSVIVFDGFLKLYQEGRDDAKENGKDQNGDRILPPLSEGAATDLQDVIPQQHFTAPPPRYTEASLVKKLEELGIGRPSTYASIIEVLQNRNYVLLEKKRFVPEDRGRLVTAFLENYFNQYVQYNFTADLENQLDEISSGNIEWKSVMRNFWTDFIAAVEETRELRIRDVIDALDADLGPHFFPEPTGDETGGETGDKTGDGTIDDKTAPAGNPRKCPSCEDGRLGLKLSKYGAFIGCSKYPDCKFTRPLAIAPNGENNGEEIAAGGPKALGIDPESGEEITLRKGPYGFYLQLGEGTPKSKGVKAVKPKRTSVPKDKDPQSIDLEMAIALVSLPREIDLHPETGKMITAGIGRFGPYVYHDGAYASLKGDEDDVLSVGINRAVDLLAQAKSRKGGGAGKLLGKHPDDSKPVTLHSGRYGPYVSHGKIRASLPKGVEGESLTLEAALALIAAKAGKTGKTKAKPKTKTKAKTKAKTKVRAKTTKAKGKPKARKKAGEESGSETATSS